MGGNPLGERVNYSAYNSAPWKDGRTSENKISWQKDWAWGEKAPSLMKSLLVQVCTLAKVCNVVNFKESPRSGYNTFLLTIMDRPENLNQILWNMAGPKFSEIIPKKIGALQNKKTLHFFKTILTNKKLEWDLIWFGRNKVNERLLDMSKLKPFQWEHIILKICNLNTWYNIILSIWKMFNFSFLLIHTYTIKGKKERRKNSKLKRFFVADVKINTS